MLVKKQCAAKIREIRVIRGLKLKNVVEKIISVRSKNLSNLLNLWLKNYQC